MDRKWNGFMVGAALRGWNWLDGCQADSMVLWWVYSGRVGKSGRRETIEASCEVMAS